ncbi:MAG: hypothetical protein FWH33_06900 [Oscillospiraceae bacterium]|nr:hypothetical protein [Oscillospiraceae bacterium]
MKRTDSFIKVTTVVLFIAVVSYVGIYFFYAAMNAYETAAAIGYTIEESFPAQGYVVRSESVLENTGMVVLPIIGEGEKVASGQAVATEYSSSEALEAASEIRTLRMTIAQLEASGDSAYDAARFSSILELSAAVQRGDLSRLDELAINIETVFFSGESAIVPNLPAMKARLGMLESQNTGIRTIYAPASGIFSQVVDGYESITPAMLEDITPEKLDAMFSSPSQVSGPGKLVTEFKWYYAVCMNAADAAKLQEGATVTVQFAGAFSAPEDMLVERIGRRENDECVVLFTSSRSVHELAPYRRLRADIVCDVITGIRVPKEAIHLDDAGVTHVFLQTGVRAERVDVEILIESGDSYLVRDGAETGSPLRAGSTIIVKANKLFDGKVVG